MAENTLKMEILKRLEHLDEDAQRRVLQLIQSIDDPVPQGTPGKDLLAYIGIIPEADLTQMEKAIEEDCEKVNSDEW